MTKNIRHGDVNFAPFYGKIESNSKEVNHKGSFVFALGETTGHKHVITVPKIEDMDIYETAVGRIYVLKTAGKLSHEEHETITIPAGTYQQVQEQEMDWFQNVSRKVID